jgi:3-hydroxybutyryl-CoA dehydrogenase
MSLGPDVNSHREVPPKLHLPAWDPRVVGVIGAGVMGAGMAQALAESDLHVLLVDVSEAILRAALQTIGQHLRFRSLFHGAPPAKQEEVLERIAPSTSYQVLAEADFVIENVTEKIEIKERVYGELDRVCRPDCVLASNTSAIPITRIGAMTGRPQQVVGMHFMNPVPLKDTVEVIRGYHTGAECVERAMTLLLRLGKQGIVVNDSPGFVSNRVLMLAINEAIFLVQEKVATIEAIDAIFKNCLGHKMGPLETADLIGLDTILLSIEVLFDEFQDTKFRPCPLLKQMVTAGLHGRKAGQGFYSYAD